MTPAESRDVATNDVDRRAKRRIERGRNQKAFGMILLVVGILASVVTLGLVVCMLIPFAALTFVCAVIAFVGARLVRAGEANAPSPDSTPSEQLRR